MAPLRSNEECLGRFLLTTVSRPIEDIDFPIQTYRKFGEVGRARHRVYAVAMIAASGSGRDGVTEEGIGKFTVGLYRRY